MKDDKKNNKKTFEEQILEGFPEDLLPDFDASEIDILNCSFAEIMAASGFRGIMESMIKDPDQKNTHNVFLDSLIEKSSKEFESIRDRLKDDTIRRKLLKEIIARSKNGK
mgnify:CR=1 FL=1|tara:strand:- start:61 stop:390 length:330 start_codon:yes stop_codon:yes gene_type:complete